LGRKKKNAVDIPTDWLPIILWPNYFYEQQSGFSYSEAFQNWFIGGNGTGKTRILWWNIIAQLLGVHPKQLGPPPIRAKCLVPSFEYVDEEVMPKILEPAFIVQTGKEIGPILPKSMVAKEFNARGFRAVKLKNGSIVRFATSEQEWKLHRGAEFDILGCDEEPEERIFDENLRGLRNAKGGGHVYGGLTPPFEAGQGPTWTKEKVVNAALDDPDIAVFRACMADNPAITAEFIKRFSAGKTQKQIDVQVWGKYPTWGDLVHPDFQNREWNPQTIDGHILPVDYPLPENWEAKWVMSFDWHPSKPCAAVWGFIDTDGNPVIWDELDKDTAEGKTIYELSEIYKQIEGQPFDKRKFRRWQDPSAKHKYSAQQRGFNAWDEFRKNGIVTSEGKNRDPGVGIDIVNDYLKGNIKDHPRLLIRKNCKQLIHAMENHYWKRSGDGGKGEPDPKWSDFPICVRYILQAVTTKKKDRRYQPNKWPLTSYGDELRA